MTTYRFISEYDGSDLGYATPEPYDPVTLRLLLCYLLRRSYVPVDGSRGTVSLDYPSVAFDLASKGLAVRAPKVAAAAA